jgi:hypothetical protein
MADLGFSGTQLGYAERIIGVGKGRGESQKNILTALMVALDESSLQNLANNAVPESLSIPHDGVGSNADSVGLFQQRPSQGWGTPAELMNPEVAAGKFYDSLDKVATPGAPEWVQAQEVQRSADPTGSNYQAKLLDAQTIMDNLYAGATISRASSVTQNTASNPLVAAGKIGAWLSNPVNMVRVGEFVFGAILVLIVLLLMFKNSQAGKAAVSVGKKVAAVAL